MEATVTETKRPSIVEDMVKVQCPKCQQKWLTNVESGECPYCCAETDKSLHRV